MNDDRQSPPPPPDFLSIPTFLRRDESPPPRSARPRTPRTRRKKAALPPDSMMPVLRALNRGRDTLQKLRSALGGKYTDTEIRDGLAALVRIGSIYRTGRRYLPIACKTPPPAKRP